MLLLELSHNLTENGSRSQRIGYCILGYGHSNTGATRVSSDTE